jgi:Nif-specific regulatory protein
MMSHHWPGNVRELEDCIERAAWLSGDGIIHAHHLPTSIQTCRLSDAPSQEHLQAWLTVLEQDPIVDVLKSALGNTARAARFLGFQESLMSRRIKKYGIDLNRFKPPGTGLRNPV